MSGLAVLIATFFASAQVFNLATPESGLPRLPFDSFPFVLLLNTLAASADRLRTLRSLAVIFGSAFILKFIVLGTLSDPGGGRTSHPITGYVAFLAFVLFGIGLSLLAADALDEHGPQSRAG